MKITWHLEIDFSCPFFFTRPKVNKLTVIKKGHQKCQSIKFRFKKKFFNASL